MDHTSVRGLAFGLKSVICRNNADPPLPSRIGKYWHRASQEGAGEKGGIVRQISNSPPSGGSMTKKHRVETERFVRVLWHCTKCDAQYWKSYGEDKGSSRERRQRWH